jgi:hypothetical protein
MATQNGALSPVWDDFDRWASHPSGDTSDLQLTMRITIDSLASYS